MHIKMRTEAHEHLAAIRPADDAMAKLVDSAVAKACRVDGDRVLDGIEAEAIKNAYLATVPAGGELTTEYSESFMSAVVANIAALTASRPESTRVLFTSSDNSLEIFRAEVVGSMQATVDRAGGRPVDINIMMFSFTDPVIADGIADIARNHPNVTVRMICDWTGLSSGRYNQPRRLANLAVREGLSNLQVKFKKDNPYVWSERKQRPTWSHSATKGLNHHKGFVTLIDGRPEKMAMGSLNWSKSAMDSNYENLQLLDRADADNRPAMQSHQNEFEAFWNNHDAALTLSEALAEKTILFNTMYAAHNVDEVVDFGAGDAINAWEDIDYAAVNENPCFDVNSFGDGETAALEGAVGRSRAKAIQYELYKYGRFDSFSELLERVPRVATLSDDALARLHEIGEFGDGRLSINTATATELDRAGVSARLAKRIVDFRDLFGAYESVAELDDVKGIGKATIKRISDNLTSHMIMAAYSGKVPGGEAGYGYATSHPQFLSVVREGPAAPYQPRARQPLVPGFRAARQEEAGDMAVQVKMLMRRAQPGQTARLALYGISPSSPEFAELKAAAERGVKIRVVAYKNYNEGAMAALGELKDAGLDVECRTLKSRVMHEKFGVVGDDVFNGSANWSNSSIKKHSEDRFLFLNMPKLAQSFVNEFELLFARGNPPS